MSTNDVSQQLIDFEKADVISPMIYPSRPTVLVSGQKPWANMEVALVPRQYVRKPEYWGIEVIGSMPEIGLPAIVPYAVQLELGSTVGTMGIEVIGADRSEKIDVSPPGEQAEVEASG